MYSVFVILIGYALCTMKPYRWELIGLSFTLAGIMCMFSDPSAERVDGVEATPLIYAICIFGAFLGAIYILCNAALVKEYPIFLLLVVQTLLGSIYLAIGLSIKEDKYEFLSVDK